MRKKKKKKKLKSRKRKRKPKSRKRKKKSSRRIFDIKLDNEKYELLKNIPGSYLSPIKEKFKSEISMEIKELLDLKENDIAIVTGSLYLAGEVLNLN